ncbi:two-component sensor histidine kinase [Chromobacterium sp. ATCC 53434]|uniref:HAMP domain-containing sensor histidine kinase n=1 Tax=Chromobacterium TaxID=535 RepID=UPI000C77D61F|nr:HAMP domain-containing sensor histidine kinase [Chromobacterium sp. ATCC 53434]AUH50265.1 two-component sensor histidine kinase [Chromobacterium sp. ATCC 53434]
MGRLFWKFFLFLWLAQLLTMFGVAGAVWLSHPERPSAAIAGGPPPEFAPGGRPPFDHPPGPPRHGPPPVVPPMLAWPLLAGSMVSLLFAALLAWYFSKPIRSLSAAFDAAAAGRLDIRIGAAMARRSDELADLGSDFDRMAERLQKLLEAQRRLLHDVSHELRSPLARLQAAVDLARQQPERTAEFIDRIERDSARMDALVGELLTLARLDAGIADGVEEDVDLAEVLADIVDDAGFEAGARRCRIETDCDASLPARGSRELLHRAIENVVRNAVRHSAEDSRIDICAHAGDGRLRLTVADRGPGVFDGDLAAIFDPFFRSGSRPAGAGYGLGLAITRRVIQAHGGEVSAGNRAGGGLVVSIELPAA